MEENDESSSELPNIHGTQEIFQRAQEAQADRRFPVNPPGVVQLPRGSKGARSLYLQRDHSNTFGFTLRHFIVYPPESIAEDDGRYAKSGSLYKPMDTIFVKEVQGQAAREAGLRNGDRIVAVNNIPTTNLTYQEVVQRISNSPQYLHLLVVPREEDVLQRLFPDTAHNPYSNQAPPHSEVERARAQKILSRHIAQQQQQQQIRADAASWRYLNQHHLYQYPVAYPRHPKLVKGVPGNELASQGQQRSAESVLDPHGRIYSGQQHEIYAEILRPNEVQLRQKSRASPQVPLYRKMGRRASEGSNLLSNAEYSGATSLTSSDGDSGHYVDTMKALQAKPQYLPSSSENIGLPEAYRMGAETHRRESTSSLSSSVADSSKDSVTSFGSNSTVTGQEIDDSVRISRVRQSVRQKEEFLRTPVLREFHSRPKKLDRPIWPPNEYPIQHSLPGRLESPGRGGVAKPTHHSLRRIRNDIDSEREMGGAAYNGDYGGGVANIVTPVAETKERKQREEVIREAEVVPSFEAEDVHTIRKENAVAEARRSVINYILAYLFPMMNQPSLYNVQKKAKEFENYPDASRTNIQLSELARLSKKVLQPNVTERAHEYEVKTTVPEGAKKDPVTTTSTATTGSLSTLKRIQRDSRSLDSSGSSSSVYEPLSSLSRQKLSGNVIISSGSKYIHCPPPDQENKSPDILTSSNENRQFRARSNSAESWATALGDKDSITATPPPPSTPGPVPPLSPLIPESVVQFQMTPSVSITPAPPTRPSSLDLEGPQRPARHKSSSERLSADFSTNLHDKAIVVRRRNKNTNLGDERTRRPESYLKATKGEQASFGSDFSDFEEVTPQALRNGSGSANSSSSVSLDRDKASASPLPYKKEANNVVREGLVHCKILEIDGKRAADRSWNKVKMVLRGPKLFMYKIGHHQSPLGTSDVSLDQSLASGVDMRTSVVRPVVDYNKRKNVLGLSTVKPCRSEFLIQAEGSEDFVDWVKTLQEQTAISTEAELDPTLGRQQAVPQQMPASTTIHVPGSHLSPQPTTKNGKSSSVGRNRSPTGQSPVSKTRKPSSQQTDNAGATSPKSKTWKGRVVKQLKKLNQSNAPSSPTTAEGSTFGIPIEDCIQSANNSCVPKFITVCTDIIDQKGLQTIGIYRVPGNNAAITALSEEVNRNYIDVPLDDPRWKDLHVVSSVLKSYLRKMPDSLITSHLYPYFIKADKFEDPKTRLEELRKLVNALPKHNYHTLKHVAMHLKRVADNSEANKMEAKNLAIVFGPTIVRPEGETMESMVTNMTSQCKIVESLITNANWFFPEQDSENKAPMVPLALPDNCDEFESNNQVLLENISKYEALKDQKDKNGALLSTLFSAAHRKMRKQSRTHTHETNREEPTTPTSPKTFTQFSLNAESKENSERSIANAKLNTIPTTVMDIEKKDRSKPPVEKNPWFNYKEDKEDFQRRIESFKEETEKMLRQPRKTEIPAVNIDPKTGHLSSSASNVNAGRQSGKPSDFLLTKTHSATNVFSRNSPSTNRNSLNSMDSKKYAQYNSNSLGNDTTRYSYNPSTRNPSDSYGADSNYKMGHYPDAIDGKSSRYPMRRGSSAENINCSTMDLNSNGGMKKVKYESENENQRKGSFDALNKLQGDEESLLLTMTKLIDQKLREKQPSPESNVLERDDLPFVDESPEKQPVNGVYKEKENVPRPTDLYKNPSLHKSQFATAKPFRTLKGNESVLKESKNVKEKEEDTRASEDVPDNERHISVTVIANKINSGPKLKRSESLNKPEKSPTAGINKVKRSESLNKTGDKLKRSDSLTKTEKTESNINKRRELLASGRKLKESTKNKRKNGMPDRSIKRRHTVGGTKDPDKVTYVDNKNQDENNPHAENNKEKGIRTSSPDLSSTRRERFFFEINLIGPENVVVALRQHALGSRPQSFPESKVFKVPLESHV